MVVALSAYSSGCTSCNKCVLLQLSHERRVYVCIFIMICDGPKNDENRYFAYYIYIGICIFYVCLLLFLFYFWHCFGIFLLKCRRVPEEQYILYYKRGKESKKKKTKLINNNTTVIHRVPLKQSCGLSNIFYFVSIHIQYINIY